MALEGVLAVTEKGSGRMGGFATRSSADALRLRPEVAELKYDDVDLSVGAHPRAGTVGACFYPEN